MCTKLSLLGILLVATAPALSPAAEKLDLKRVSPVAATEQIPVMDFFRAPLLTGPKLNSAGTHFAAMVDTGTDRAALLICDLVKLKNNVINGSKNKDIDWIEWLDQTHIMMSMISDKHYAEGLFITDITRPTEGYPVESYSATALVGIPKATPLKPLIWIYRNAYDEGHDMGVVQIDATKKLGRNLDAQPGSLQDRAKREESSLYGAWASIVQNYPAPPGGGVVGDYLADKDGQLAFAIVVDQGVNALFRFENKRWKKCVADLDLIYPVAVGDKVNELVVVGPREEGKPRSLRRFDASTGVLGDVLFQDKAYDLTDCTFYRHPLTKAILGVRFSRSLYQSFWFDQSYATVQKLLGDKFPGHVVKILGSDEVENRFFVAAYSDRQPISYYMLDLKAKSLDLVRSGAPWIDPARMRPMDIVKVKTRDGHQLEAYLTLPAGASKANPAPLVVLPHGGPWVRDSWGYDGEVQFLASRGYAVFQPNYRGSAGYGWMFPEEDNWAFRKMHEDVTDAVKSLVKTGMVDPSRIAIMGTSFGGYLALCGVAFERDLYRCAITVSGVFDWEQVLKEKKFDQYDNAAYGIFLRNLGNPKSNRDQFNQISPLRHISEVNVPVFVAHGKDDQVAEITESLALIDALKKFNVQHEIMLVGNEGHGMQNLSNQVELYSRIEAFLAKNMTPVRVLSTVPSLGSP